MTPNSRHGAAAIVSLTQIVLLAVFACGAPRAYTPVASGSALLSPTPASPAAGYKSYVSQEWLYSLEFPAAWYSFPVQPASDFASTKSFSNENTQSPEGLSTDGIFVALTVDPKDSVCPPGPGSNDPKITSEPITLDGVATTERTYTNGIGVDVAHAGWCYRFSFLTAGPATRDKYRGQIDRILSSFRFKR